MLCFQFVSVAGFFVNLIGIVSFRHNHSHHGHSHAAAVTQTHGSPSSHAHSHVSSHLHSAACSASHSHADHSHAISLPSSPAVTHNTNMEGFCHFVGILFYLAVAVNANVTEQSLETCCSVKMSVTCMRYILIEDIHCVSKKRVNFEMVYFKIISINFDDIWQKITRILTLY